MEESYGAALGSVAEAAARNNGSADSRPTSREGAPVLDLPPTGAATR
jgi:hypothetical protein